MICPACQHEMHPFQELTENGMVDKCPRLECGAVLGAASGPAVSRFRAGGVLDGRMNAIPVRPVPAARVAAPALDSGAVAPALPPELLQRALFQALGIALPTASPPTPSVAVPSTAGSIREQAERRLAEVNAELARLETLRSERDDLMAMLGIREPVSAPRVLPFRAAGDE